MLAQLERGDFLMQFRVGHFIREQVRRSVYRENLSQSVLECYGESE